MEIKNKMILLTIYSYLKIIDQMILKKLHPVQHKKVEMVKRG